ncbi:hypothetical protein LDC_0004 [sediment metagenome]|uniref:Uncharacterized protein n=1 Tax=sediment metagenome TaxID=749907 RepID=D9PES6_9ZZZZ
MVGGEIYFAYTIKVGTPEDKVGSFKRKTRIFNGVKTRIKKEYDICSNPVFCTKKHTVCEFIKNQKKED